MKLNRDLNPDQYEDDDVFYAELRRQILLLTADEDEDLDSKHSNSNLNATKSSSLHELTSLSSALQPAGSYFNWWETENTNLAPRWLVNLWRNGNGTGVFIPHIVNSRRYMPGRTRNQKTKTFRRLGNQM